MIRVSFRYKGSPIVGVVAGVVDKKGVTHIVVRTDEGTFIEAPIEAVGKE